MNEVKWCEVFDTEEIIVLDSKEHEDKVEIEFEMPFILSKAALKYYEGLKSHNMYIPLHVLIEIASIKPDKMPCSKYVDMSEIEQYAIEYRYLVKNSEKLEQEFVDEKIVSRQEFEELFEKHLNENI